MADNEQERYSRPEIDDPIKWDKDEAPTEYVPTEFEKKVKAIPEDKWLLYQTLGGAVVGAVVAALLFASGSGLSAGFLIAVVLALLLPNWLEDKCRRKLNRARVVMIAVMAVGIVAMVLYNGFTYGWDFFKKQEAAASFMAPLTSLRKRSRQS